MEYQSAPNLLLESLAYCGRKASGNTWAHMEQRLQQRRAVTGDAFQSRFAELKQLTARIDRTLARQKASAEATLSLFCNLEGFPFNTIGSSSPAFLLFYPMLEEFDGELTPVTERIRNLRPEQVARNILETLDILGDLPDDAMLSSPEFINTVLSLSIPDSSKLSILQIYGSYPVMAQQVSDFLEPLLQALQGELPALLDLTASFAAEMSTMSQDHFFGHLTHLTPIAGVHYRIRPFIFGPDTNLTFNKRAGDVDIYCGFLRSELLHIINDQSSREDSLYSLYHLLGDRTRFDILYYLRDHAAYGQELSEHFGLSRNTIHHHMSKMISAGLISCTEDGNRIYYTMNRDAVSDFLQLQQELFFGE